VQLQGVDGDSVLNTYKKCLRLRREVPALQTGSLQILDGAEIDPELLVYTRKDSDQTVLVGINFSNKTASFINPTGCHQILLGVGMDPLDAVGTIEFPPFSAIILLG